MTGYVPSGDMLDVLLKIIETNYEDIDRPHMDHLIIELLHNRETLSKAQAELGKTIGKEHCGFTVPKGTQVLVNAWAIGRDPSMWENPDTFMPERFLGSDIDTKGKNFELIPFDAGRRICPGLPLAIRMTHLMLASLIHCFDWKFEDGITFKDKNMYEKSGNHFAFGSTF
ncbi:putative Cytochrome P450 [Quillaja saponaria]|uniref:Cytochrome P450 n=1 Tax=Quillaja saponaria TaxID=32244 RepID=A0AAD7PJQ9_QUISA|nr:putative Cytochrome P450 [Quillaja saponaria]